MNKRGHVEESRTRRSFIELDDHMKSEDGLHDNSGNAVRDGPNGARGFKIGWEYRRAMGGRKQVRLL